MNKGHLPFPHGNVELQQNTVSIGKEFCDGYNGYMLPESITNQLIASGLPDEIVQSMCVITEDFDPNNINGVLQFYIPEELFLNLTVACNNILKINGLTPIVTNIATCESDLGNTRKPIEQSNDNNYYSYGGYTLRLDLVDNHIDINGNKVELLKFFEAISDSLLIQEQLPENVSNLVAIENMPSTPTVPILREGESIPNFVPYALGTAILIFAISSGAIKLPKLTMPKLFKKKPE